jgi:hypothetical protein
MSQTFRTTTSSSSSSFHTIFCDSLKRYREKTKNDLLTHPFTTDLQNCELPGDILAILYQKYNVQGFIQSHSGDNTSEQWLNATFTVLSSFSAALGEGVGLVIIQRLTGEPPFLNYSFCRHFHPQRSSLRESVPFS